jgi:pimeloyl-ACP methyl ester carboxylesterase
MKLDAQCATIDVALDPADTQSDTIALAIAKIPARRQTAHKDAFTMIAGGPGQSALESYQSIASAFRHIRRDRDVILIDQRGTGKSSRLNCPPAPETIGLQLQFDPMETAKQAALCLGSLDADPRFFTTSAAVSDLETVRQQLGISQWNVYGISYGTRVALHYLRRYPNSVRTMTLDAVVPPQLALGPDIAALAQRSLDHIFDRCQQNQGCADAFGHQGEATMQLMQSLEQKPRTISYEDIASGKLTKREFTREDLAVTLRLMSYSSQTAAILPSMLNDAMTQDNFAPLARQSDLQTQSLSDTLAVGMHHAIVCTEDAPFLDQQPSATDRPNDDSTYLGSAVVESIKATCKSWPQGLIDEDFKDPVISDVPTLILSGGADPVTPPDYGDLVASTLENNYHIINGDEGHMQAAFGCIPVVLARFIEQASIEQLEDDCLQRIRPLPFFIDANGPLP